MSKNDAYRIRARISTIFAGRVSLVSDDLVLYNFTPDHARALAAELLAAADLAEPVRAMSEQQQFEETLGRG